MPDKPNRYISALSFRWLTPLYDPILKWIMREAAFNHRLIQQANIQPYPSLHTLYPSLRRSSYNGAKLLKKEEIHNKPQW
jgi:hypothetical protein